MRHLRLFKKVACQLSLGTAVLCGLSLRAHAVDFITGYAWVTTDNNSQKASSATLTFSDCHRGIEPCTHANADLTFITSGIDFVTNSTEPASSQTFAEFLNSSAFPINNKVYRNNTSDATELQFALFEFGGQGTFTGTPQSPQTFTIQHDDGVTLAVNGQIVENRPGPTPPVVTTGTYTGGAGTNLPFQLIYAEAVQPPAVLKTSLLGPQAAPDQFLSTIVVTPPTATVALNGSQQFSAQGYDQNHNPINATFTWSVGNTANGISQTGLFTGLKPGNDIVTATSGVLFGTATVIVQGAPQTPPSLAKIVVQPLASVRKPGDPISFTAQGYDQDGKQIAVPSFTWSLDATAGTHSTIDSTNGSYTAGNPNTFPALDRITATAGSVQGHATVTIVNSGEGLTIQSITAVPNPVHGTATQLTVIATTPSGTLTYQWDPSSYSYVTPGLSTTTLNFSGPGLFNPQVTVLDGVHFPVSASIAVPVIQTLTRIDVSPNGRTIRPLESLTFTKTLFDQWDHIMPDDVVTWSSQGGGSIDGARGIFSSPVVQKTITIRATHASGVYGVAAVTVDGPPLSFDITGAFAYPVPWKSTMGVPNITFFVNKAAGTDIRIFTSTARLVKRLSSINGENVFWDLTNKDGERVASGVYFYFIDNGTSGQRVKGKLVVIQ